LAKNGRFMANSVLQKYFKIKNQGGQTQVFKALKFDRVLKLGDILWAKQWGMTLAFSVEIPSTYNAAVV